jgi:adenosylcobinamide kinase/adenosylcobinamide-phosphate guanylyltransferase
VGEIWFVTGGARSGKSGYAQRLAAGTDLPVVFVATMEPLDEELTSRVARHRAERPAGWWTIEAPLDLLDALATPPGSSCVVVDCLSLWVANRLLAVGEQPTARALDELEQELDGELDRLVDLLDERSGPTILVTNEVGAGVVPESALGRAYRDLLGRVNQRAAERATRAWLLVAGRAVELPASATGT